MAVLRITTNVFVNRILQPSSSFSVLVSDRNLRTVLVLSNVSHRIPQREISLGGVRCSASGDGGGKKVSARLSQVQQLLQDAEERALAADNEPSPKITLGLFNMYPTLLCLVPEKI